MPTVGKAGNYGVEAENIGAEGGIASATSESKLINNVASTANAKKSLSGRSAFSDTDLKSKLSQGEGGDVAKDGVFSRYSESNIQLAKLDVPFPDDSKSETSGESGLAIVPSMEDRSLLSQNSGRELIPAASKEIMSTEDLVKDECIQEGKGTNFTHNICAYNC